MAMQYKMMTGLTIFLFFTSLFTSIEERRNTMKIKKHSAIRDDCEENMLNMLYNSIPAKKLEYSKLFRPDLKLYMIKIEKRDCILLNV